MKRGDVWWAILPEPQGSGPGFRRPVVVVQSNPFNDSRIATVIVATFTSNLMLSTVGGNVRLGKSETGLAKTSVVNVSQLSTIDRVLLTKRVRGLSADAMRRIDQGLRLVLSL